VADARGFRRRLGTAALAAGLVLTAAAGGRAAAPDVGKSYRVPYRLTATNHFLVRARVNGKGPFNFLVDTGAPAIFLATEAARKAGLKVDPDAFWTPLERLDFEGGATLHNVQARVEDPYQLVGMNALGLPGASIDGLLGFTALARFRIELDPTDDRMTWTRLDFDPADPTVPRRDPKARPPGELQAMNALGGVAKIAAALIGKQPEDELLPRGFVGLELGEAGKGAEEGVRVERVTAGSSAAKAGVKTGDRLMKVNGRAVKDAKDARAAVAALRVGSSVSLTFRRPGESADFTRDVAAGEGF
jgi:hypothetical protein